MKQGSHNTIKHLVTSGKIIISIILVYIISNKVNLNSVNQITSKIDDSHLFTGVIFFTISMVFEVLKLHVLIRDFEKINTTIKITCIGNFFNNFLPSNIGGDVYKIFYLGSKINVLQASVFVLIDRIIGILTIAICSFLVIINSNYKFIIHKKLLETVRQHTNIHIYILTIITFSLILFLINGYKKERNIAKITYTYINKIIAAVKKVTPSKCCAASLCSGGFHFFRILGVYYFLLSLGHKVGLPEILVVMTFTAVISLLPISIGALGLREGAFIFGFGFFGVNFNAAASTALLVRIILLLPALCGGVWLMQDKKIVKQMKTYSCK
jgi:hypothetical protein